MDLRIQWSEKAVGDLGEHVAFQRRVSVEAASGLAAKILSAGESLTTFPERFQEFEMPSGFPVVVRKCVVDKRYILLYGIENERVIIYRVLDARRKFDGLLR